LWTYAGLDFPWPNIENAVTSRLQELNTPDVALSCPRTEGPLLGGVKPRVLPPGRALLCSRRGSKLIQTGFVGADSPADSGADTPAGGVAG
jgi:S-DNA-T family DNA segregation ATPase FtsK/SpoIIIE